MSLLCSETGKDIEFGSPLYAALCEGGKSFYALSQEAISQIPASERHKEPAKAGEGDNIYVATSTRNLNGSYALCNFNIDRAQFRFSVSNDAAHAYLPRHTGRRLADEAA